MTKILEAPELHSAAPPQPYLSSVLGYCQKSLSPADPAKFLPLAIAAYDRALRGWDRGRDPADWAMTMNNRGNAYAELPVPNRATNLQEAIRCYDQALQVRTRDRYPTQWAMTTNNRGTAYQELPGPDRAANLKEAIRCYDQALQVYTRDRYMLAKIWTLFEARWPPCRLTGRRAEVSSTSAARELSARLHSSA